MEHFAKFEGNFYIKLQDKSLEEIEDEFLENVEFASYNLTVIDETGDEANDPC